MIFQASHIQTQLIILHKVDGESFRVVDSGASEILGLLQAAGARTDHRQTSPRIHVIIPVLVLFP